MSVRFLVVASAAASSAAGAWGPQGSRAPVASAAVRAELERVLSRAEFHRQQSLLERFLEWLFSELGAREVDVLGDVVRALLVVAAVVALVLLARRFLRDFRGRTPAPAGAPAATSDLGARLAGLAAAARAARAGGDLRLALRLLFQALLLALGGRGDLELRPAWTNRELLRRGKPKKRSRALLEALVRELEPKEFGRASISEADVERLEDLLAPHLAARGSSS